MKGLLGAGVLTERLSAAGDSSLLNLTPGRGSGVSRDSAAWCRASSSVLDPASSPCSVTPVCWIYSPLSVGIRLL